MSPGQKVTGRLHWPCWIHFQSTSSHDQQNSTSWWWLDPRGKSQNKVEATMPVWPGLRSHAYCIDPPNQLWFFVEKTGKGKNNRKRGSRGATLGQRMPPLKPQFSHSSGSPPIRFSHIAPTIRCKSTRTAVFECSIQESIHGIRHSSWHTEAIQ